MFILQSGDKNNKNEVNFLKNESNKEKIIENTSYFAVYGLIFENYASLTENGIRCVQASLAVGDEIEGLNAKYICDTLFFALCVNTSKGSMKIKNMQQAFILMNLYENDYRLVEPAEDDRRPNWVDLDLQFKTMPDGAKVLFKIPISSFNANGKRMYTLSGIDHCLMSVSGFDELFHVPRVLYIYFFKEAMKKGRIIRDSIEGIKDGFLKKDDVLMDCLLASGFISRSEDRNIEVYREYFMQDGKVTSIYPQETGIWIPKGHLNVLHPEFRYVPFIGENGSVTLMRQ